MTLHLTAERLVFDGLSAKNGIPGLKLCVNRYIVPPQSTRNTNGLTLLFTHGVASHKEVWEPVIERLFHLQQFKHKSHHIREAYSFDWQNHGEASLLNEDALKLHPQGVSGYELAAAIAAFVKAYRLEGGNTIAVGHSYGAGILVCSTKEFPQDTPPYASVILVEPIMIPQEVFTENHDANRSAAAMLIRGSLGRRDVWEDGDAAIRWLETRSVWKNWDQRALQLHATHALHTLGDGHGVTLSCSKQQEARCWDHMESHPNAGKPSRSILLESAEIFKNIRKKTPIHIIWGSRNTCTPEYIQHALVDTYLGRVPGATAAIVEGAGHLVVQEKPLALAQEIADFLDNMPIKHTPTSKL